MDMSKYSPVAKRITLSKDCIDFIVGTVFGDGCLAKPAKNARLHLTHGHSQLDYIKHKSELLESINPNGVKSSQLYDKRADKYYPSHKICTYTNEQLTDLYKIFYPQGKKIITKKALSMLTPRGIAYWYMDDGGLGISNQGEGKAPIVSLYLNTYLTDVEHDIIINYFKVNYGIEFKKNKNKGMYRLRIGKKQARKFAKIIKPYILPMFEYKLKYLL